MREVEGLDQLQSLVAHEMGPTAWVTISEEMVNRFADVTHDHQWIHVDAERARQESPYGVPIAHGLLTLALYPYLGRQLLKINGDAVRMTSTFVIESEGQAKPACVAETVALIYG